MIENAMHRKRRKERGVKGGAFWKKNGRWAAVFVLIVLALCGSGCGKSKPAKETGVASAAPPITRGDRLYDICTVDKDIWVVGYFGKVVHSGDGGKTWQTRNPKSRRTP